MLSDTKRQVINLWNGCIWLVNLFELYDDARTCRRQIPIWRLQILEMWLPEHGDSAFLEMSLCFSQPTRRHRPETCASKSKPWQRQILHNQIRRPVICSAPLALWRRSNDAPCLPNPTINPPQSFRSCEKQAGCVRNVDSSKHSDTSVTEDIPRL